MSSLFSKCFDINRGGIRYLFHADGSLCRMDADGLLLNSMVTSPAEGQIGEIVLRLWEDGCPTVRPLTGRGSSACLFRGSNGLRWHTQESLFAADVSFLPGESGWIWKVQVETDCTYDLLYMQDVGLAQVAAQRTNELYTAQYLAHHVRASQYGCVIASRQNMPQGGQRPCLWQGMLKGQAVSFSTDGKQYFGNGIRRGGQPAAYSAPQLPGEILQGESACIALQTEKCSGAGEYIFFARYQKDHPDIIREGELPELSGLLKLCGESVLQEEACAEASPCAFVYNAYTSPRFTEREIDEIFTERELEERKDGELLSFFLNDHRHVVLQGKDILCERAHASILTTLFRADELPDDLLTTSVCMYGNFAAQTVIGNTSLHKLSSVNRGIYDLLPLSGTRLWVRTGDEWLRLGLPAAFVMDIHSAVWYYKLDDDLLTVTTYMQAAEPVMHLTVNSRSGRGCRFMLSMRTVMGDQEYDQEADLRADDQAIELRMAPGSGCLYPDLYYRIQPSVSFQSGNDEVFFPDAQRHDRSVLTLVTEPCADLDISISADLYGQPHPVQSCERTEAEKYKTAYRDFLHGFELSIPGAPVIAQRIGHTVWWYLHNAMVHFCVPHGLEQTGGAAWGTRDVCQGPFELFLATGHTALARKVLLAVFAHQQQDGDWPQWFMFDRYEQIHAGDSHGDIILWPLKCLGDYLSQTQDRSVLAEQVPWLEGCCAPASLEEHLQRTLKLLSGRFIPDTDLLAYGGGDWDDTLQPAHGELRDKMSSSWTQALAYQAVTALLDSGLTGGGLLPVLQTRLRSGFRAVWRDDGIPGFCYVEDAGSISRLIAPGDTYTGIQYRLLPHTRCILAGLTSPEESETCLRLVKEHLLAPDGAHLLDRATHYAGGNCTVFRRAEQAANVGREIGLQYVHAHIRYIEALAHAKHAAEAWAALLMITPPLLETSVPHALPRQSNMYFSSSDADLPTRAAFEERYVQVMRGQVPVKGGWRLYSSGPGIWLARLLNDLLALRGGKPVIPDALDGLTVTVKQEGGCIRKAYSAAAGAYIEQ